MSKAFDEKDIEIGRLIRENEALSAQKKTSYENLMEY